MSEYLTEAEAAAVANAEGVPVSPRTLANWRWAGKGPLFIKIRRAVRYRRADVVAWAKTEIGAPQQCTSERTPSNDEAKSG